jgi:hypothetical protein
MFSSVLIYDTIFILSMVNSIYCSKVPSRTDKYPIVKVAIIETRYSMHY